MMNRAVLFLLCSFFICVSTSAQSYKSAGKNSQGQTLFSVNKKSVSTDEFIYLYKKNHQDTANDYSKEKIQEYLSLYINFKLKVEEARKRGMDTTEAFKKEFNQYKDELRKPYLPGNNLTDSLVKVTYERMKQEVKASHILIGVSADAPPADTLRAYNKITDLRARILGGEDFAKVAVAFSEDPSVKVNNGDLGYFTAMQMVYPFENAAFSTNAGDVSMPVRTRFGYHILKVFDKRPSRGEVEVAHIMIRTGEDKSNDQAKGMIFDAYEKLQAGVPWDEVCKQHSEDPSTKDNGGKLRPFGTGMMSNVPEFERVAFELETPGQYSDPVQTQFGWHIVRLEKKIPLAPLSEIEPTLKSKVARDERSQISKQALQVKLRKDLGFSENKSTKDRVMALADTTLRKAKWNPATVASLSSETLFSFTDRNILAGEFLGYAKKNQRPNRQDPVKYLESLYQNFVDEKMIGIQEEKISANNPEFKYLLNEYYEGILLFEIMEKEVWNKASDDSLGQLKYYQDNTAKFQAPQRLRATIYSAQTRDFVDELKPLLEKGDNKAVQEFTAAHKIKAESGYYKKEDKAILTQVAWAPGFHTAENNGMYYLAWIKDVLPAGQMSFDEARPVLISDYQNFLEESWVKELKEKYPVKINKKGEQLVMEKLQKK